MTSITPPPPLKSDWWNNFLAAMGTPGYTSTSPATPSARANPMDGYVQGGRPANVYNNTEAPWQQHIAGTQRGQGDGLLYYVDANGLPLGLVPGQSTTTNNGNTGNTHGNIYGGSASPAITQYEQQQIALERQRLADAEAQQKQAQQLAESQTLDKFNTDFRDFQLKSPYGGQYGPTYFSPAGSVFAQRVPESSILKQSFKDSGQVDPFSVTGNVPAGYTGTTYENPQHPGLVDFGHSYVQNPQPQEQAQPMPQGFSTWHDIAHGLPQPAPASAPTQPVQVAGQPMNLPSFDQGGTVPGASGSPQLIVAHGGETVTPQPSSPDGMNGGGDWQSMFNAWHDALHQSQTNASQSTPNAYGQMTSPNVIHGANEDFRPAPLGYNPATQKYLNNHVQYGPELTGMSGYGGLITPTGTPVVMSEWQKQQFDPTSLSNYADYAKSIAGWSPEDLAQSGTRTTGNVGDLSRPTTWAPIGIQPAPSGG